MEMIEPVFVVQTLVSLSSLTFSMYMLSQGQSPGLYLPVITAIIGYWIPSPTSASKDKRVDSLSSPSPSEVVQVNQTLPV
jgi:hypothetical protein